MHFAYARKRSKLDGMSQSDKASGSGIALMTASATASQFGAATAALAFPVLGPAGVVAIRQWVAAAVLLATVRPRFTAFTRAQWRPVLALALTVATMNVTLYAAVARIGLGLGVTLEFLGPLSVALLASRRRLDLGCALVAGAGVLLLARPRLTADYAGIFLGLVAAACWAAYILVNRVVGARVAGAAGPATAAGVSALAYLPVGAWVLATHSVTVVALGRAAVAGLLCSAVPMTCDLLALRRVPARFFGVFMSVNPVLAALIGLLVLHQSLALLDWLGIAVIVAANAVSVGISYRGDSSSSSTSATTSSRSSRVFTPTVSVACADENIVVKACRNASSPRFPDSGVTLSETNASAPVGMGSQKLTTRQPSTPSVATPRGVPKPTSSSGAIESTTPSPPGVIGSAPATLAMP
jgi:inner membrane transporter RhtA